MDAQVGKIITALDNSEDSDNTLVILIGVSVQTCNDWTN
jgi:arylsulfatase A-like enzyme